MHCKKSEVKEAKQHLPVVEMSSKKVMIRKVGMTILYRCWRTGDGSAALLGRTAPQSAICNFRTGYCSCAVPKLIRADYE